MKIFTFKHKTKYLGKFRHVTVLLGLWVDIRLIDTELQNCCYHCLTVHAQEIGFSESNRLLQYSPKIAYSGVALGFWLQPLSADNFILQVLDNLGNVLGRQGGVHQCILDDLFENFPSRLLILFTVHSENFNVGSIVEIDRGKSSTVEFQILLAKKVGHKCPNPCKDRWKPCNTR